MRVEMRRSGDSRVVLKPLGLSGSRGVIRANDAHEFAAARSADPRACSPGRQVRAARAGPRGRDPGRGLHRGARVRARRRPDERRAAVFAIFDKPDPLKGPFFEETIYVTPSPLPAVAQARVVEHVAPRRAALGLTTADPRRVPDLVRQGRVYVLEVAARPIGGLCSRAVAVGLSVPRVLRVLKAQVPGCDGASERLAASTCDGAGCVP